MSKKTEIEMTELMAQCETALTDYASRTGAEAFANSTSAGAAKAAIKPKLKSQQALAKMAKSLAASRANSSENIAKLEAKITAKADSIKHHKRQQEALKQEQEQARKADLANKRKALYRTPEPQPKLNQKLTYRLKRRLNYLWIQAYAIEVLVKARPICAAHNSPL